MFTRLPFTRASRKTHGAEPLQAAAEHPASSIAKAVPGLHYANNSWQRSTGAGQGLPANLRSGIESLSGMDMSDVRVHYASPLPARVNALAYAQGAHIHLARGEEKQLPHEAWHVVQQWQGRVAPTTRLAGAQVNDDARLEREADRMGAQAMRCAGDSFAADAQVQGWLPRKPTPHPVTQRVKKVVATEGLEEPQEYLVIDVPADGACLLHSFNIGSALDRYLDYLLTYYPAGSLSMEQVEQMARDEFVSATLNDGEKITDSSREDQNVAYDVANKGARAAIARYWRDQLDQGDAATLASLKRDIQGIINTFLTRAGLLGASGQNARDDEPNVPAEKTDAAVFDSSQALSPDVWSPPSSSGSMGMDDSPVTDEPTTDAAQAIDYGSTDFDFTYDAVYHPERLRTLKLLPSKHGSEDKRRASMQPLPQHLFAITAEEFFAEPVPSGVREAGTLAEGIKDYVLELAQPHLLANFLPMHSVVLPPAGAIPDALVEAYIDEFETNLHLWASQSALGAATAISGSVAASHTFTDEDIHVGSSAFDADVNIYEEGAQTHFQFMLGPFPAGWFTDDAIPEHASPSSSLGRDGSQDDFRIDDDAPFASGLSGPVPADDSFDEMGSDGRAAFNADDLSEDEEDFIDRVALQLGQDFPARSDVLELVFRAAGVMGTENAFSDAKAAVAAVMAYQDEVETRSQAARSLGREYTPPLVPLAGFVGEMITQLGVPLSVLEEILPFATQYVNFHKKSKTWKEGQAGPRVTALKEMAKILNEWAGILDEPRLAVSPSIAQTVSVLSPFSSSEHVGVGMRAVLTLDPGEMSGYEPEESQTWDAFREHLRGFVRAHLLNKHVGGRGSPSNIGYISDTDNLRMSSYGEEYVKREVLENNKRMFYRVDLPIGKPELSSEPHYLDERISGMLAYEVGLTAAELHPFQNDEGEDDLEYRNVHLKDVLGIKDDDVQQDSEGRLSFPTVNPDPSFISRIRPHHRNVMRGTIASAQNQRLETVFSESAVKRIVTDAQRRIVASGDTGAYDQIIKEAAGQLSAEGLSSLEVERHVARLAAVRRQAGSVSKAKQQKKEKEGKRSKQRKRQAFLKHYEGKLSPEQIGIVNGCADQVFDRIVAAIDAGASVGEAIGIGQLREPKYSAALNGLKTRAAGGGISRFFKK